MQKLSMAIRQVIAISNLRLRTVFFDWKSWLLMLALPIAFSVLFGLMTLGADDQQEGLLQVGIISDEVQQLSNDAALSSYLIDTLRIDAVQDYDWQLGERAHILEEVRTGNLLAAIEWVENTETPAGGEVIVWKVQQAAEQIAFEARLQLHLREMIILQSVLKEVELQEQVIQKWSTNKLEIDWQYLTQQAQIQKEVEEKSNIGDATQVQLAIGFTVMFVMMNILVSSSMLQKERANKTWQRLLMAPLNNTKLFLGYSVGLFTIGILQFLVLMVATSLIFKVSWGNVFLVLLLMGIFIMSVTALALLLASCLKSEQQQQTVGSVLVIASSMIAGIFWPLEVAPAIMQQVAVITPQFWLLEGLYDVVFVGAGIVAVAQTVFVLLGFTVVSYLLWLITVKN